MRKMGIESLPAVTLGRDRLLLRIDPFTVRILRTYHDGAGRTYDRETLIFVSGIDAELERVVSDDLWVVRRVVARQDAFKFVQRYALIGAHRQVTPETGRRPGSVADLAGNVR